MAVVLFTLDGEIDRFRDAAADTVYVVSARKVTQYDLIVLGSRDQVPIRVQQVEIDPLVSVVLVDARVEPASPKRKRNFDGRLRRLDRTRVALVKAVSIVATTGGWSRCRRWRCSWCGSWRGARCWGRVRRDVKLRAGASIGVQEKAAGQR